VISSRSKVTAASFFTAAILDFRLSVARGKIDSSTIEFIDLENREVAVGISFLCAIELDMSGVRCDPSLRASRQ
jgi:hypothetical protein